MKKIFVYAALMLCAASFPLRAQDTVRYGDSAYMIASPGHGLRRIYDEGSMWETFGSSLGFSYIADGIDTVYGIAFPTKRPIYDGSMWATFGISLGFSYIADGIDTVYGVAFPAQRPPDGFQNFYAYIAVMNRDYADNRHVAVLARTPWYVDSVNRYIDVELHSHGDIVHEYTGCYELYFNTPVVVRDTFFVGFQFYPYWAGGQYYGRCYVFINREDVYTHRCILNIADDGSVASLYTGDPRWPVFFPILAKPDSAWLPNRNHGVECPQPSNFRTLSKGVNSIYLGWDIAGMDGVEQYEVACVVTDFDDSNACSIVVPRTRRLVHFTDIDTTNGLLRRRFYLRSQCHHTCAFHPTDTLVWGEWGSPILEVFGYRGLHGGDTIVHDTIVHDTVDIAVPGLYDAMPEVYPNPASATLSVRLKDGGAPLRCDVCDLQGRLLISSGKETIDVSHLPQGTYLLKTVTPQGAFVTRFVIKR